MDDRAAEFLERLCASSDDPRPLPTTTLIVAHPDDEVVGAGARLPRLRQASVVHVTDGAPRDLRDATASGFATRLDYARARRRELLAALRLAGIAPEQTCELGCVDQEASLHLVELARSLVALVSELQPEVIITHPYEGGHPDHDATALAVHAACRLLEHRNGRPPTVVEMTSYHNSASGIAVAEFLPSTGCEATTLVLSAEERDFKRRLLDCFPTQRQTLSLFSTEIERFRLAPCYDFTRPPHAGQLFYERFPWGITGDHFRQSAREALDTLGITGPL